MFPDQGLPWQLERCYLQTMVILIDGLCELCKLLCACVHVQLALAGPSGSPPTHCLSIPWNFGSPLNSPIALLLTQLDTS